MNISDFWERVKSRLRAKSITHENAAKLCGFNLNTFHSWTSKNIIPSTEDVYRLACLLDTSVEFLLTGKKSDINTELAEIRSLLKTACKKLEKLE